MNILCDIYIGTNQVLVWVHTDSGVTRGIYQSHFELVQEHNSVTEARLVRHLRDVLLQIPKEIRPQLQPRIIYTHPWSIVQFYNKVTTPSTGVLTDLDISALVQSVVAEQSLPGVWIPTVLLRNTIRNGVIIPIGAQCAECTVWLVTISVDESLHAHIVRELQYTGISSIMHGVSHMDIFGMYDKTAKKAIYIDIQVFPESFVVQRNTAPYTLIHNPAVSIHSIANTIIKIAPESFSEVCITMSDTLESSAIQVSDIIRYMSVQYPDIKWISAGHYIDTPIIEKINRVFSDAYYTIYFPYDR